jgi:prolyl 4-hydroxylase
MEDYCIQVRKTHKYYNTTEYDPTDEKMKELMKIHDFKKKPRFINYKKFYDLKIPETAEKLNYPFTQIYVQKNFLSQEECDEAIDYMDTELHPSAVSNEEDRVMISPYRTSMTCNFSPHLTQLGADLTINIGNYMNLDPFLGESIQGQKYEEGEFYKSHWDYYHPLSAEYKTYCEWMGQRTWTFMIYLNDVEEGGETYFKFLDLKIKPEPGLAIFWNNLYSFGWPNFKTMHEALPPTKGKKYILTKWYRAWSLI